MSHDPDPDVSRSVFPTQRHSYTFLASDSPRWLSHLETEGFCVIKAAVAPDEASRALESFWAELIANSDSRINRGDPSTWLRKSGWPGGGRGFLVEKGGGCHLRAAWDLRVLPAIRDCFAKIWETRELLVSMDTFIAWRPWQAPGAPSEFQPVVEGLHIDQNPSVKRGRQAVQGMIPLLPVTHATGGLAVVPRSHTQDAQDRLIAANPVWAGHGDDWCLLKGTRGLGGAPMLLEADAGDLLLWDSRLVHEGKVGTGLTVGADLPAVGGVGASEAPLAAPLPQLARLALTVCMTPKARATPEVLAARRAAFASGAGMTHWPHEATQAGPDAPPGWVPPALTPEQLSLVS